MTAPPTTFTPTPHPLLPLPSESEVAAILSTPDGPRDLAAWYLDREERIRKSELDPLNHGFELDCWRDADEQQLQCAVLGNFGGNRTSKSERAAKRIVEAAMAYPRSVIACISESEVTSISQQQKYVWKYLAHHVGHLNGKRNPVWKVNYTQATGFSERKCVLPNRTEIYFFTFNQNPGDYEGWEFGARVTELKRTADGRVIPNMGFWGDESLPLVWLTMLWRRVRYRKATGIWTFTAVKGITPAMKEMLGPNPQTLESRPSDLLPAARIPGCPVGHMPYVQVPSMPECRVIYFHLGSNPFGGYTQEIRRLCEGKSTEYIERVAYGYARDVAARAFPKFGAWNIVKESHLPAVGTNYMFVDPAPARNIFTIWLRVTPGPVPRIYIYRDWPDEQTYGEWAMPTERDVSADSKKGWDGDPGPAQMSLGLGVVSYKKLWLDKERITPVFTDTGAIANVDPHHVALVRDACRAAGVWDPATETCTLGRDARAEWSRTVEIRETIRQRFIDSRAGKDQHLAEQGGTCPVEQFAATQTNPRTGAIEGPSLIFYLASGASEAAGLDMINTLLDWNTEAPLDPVFNAPRLYVSERCRQVIWALGNYTGRAGEQGACKDPVDVIRYAALEDLRHADAGTLKARGGGSY